MTDKEYNKAKEECWVDFCRKFLPEADSEATMKDVIDYAFDRAFALGKQTETITQEEIESHSVGYATDVNNARLSSYPEAIRTQLFPEYGMDDLANAFEAGANFALGKQETKQETNSFQNGNTSNYSGNLNSSQPVTGNHFADVRKMADTRLNIAAMVMAGALANKNVTIGCGAFEDNLEYITKTALMYADALIAECEKGGKNA